MGSRKVLRDVKMSRAFDRRAVLTIKSVSDFGVDERSLHSRFISFISLIQLNPHHSTVFLLIDEQNGSPGYQAQAQRAKHITSLPKSHPPPSRKGEGIGKLGCRTLSRTPQTSSTT